MKGPNTLIHAEDNWQTDMGAWFSGERVVFRGKDLFTKLHNHSWFELLILGITGREFSHNEIQLFEKIWSLTISYPEPRLWNNRIASLTATANSTGILATSAATSASEATIYGNQINIVAMDFIKRAKEIIDNNDSLTDFVIKELKEKRVIPGYGRPIVQKDERIQPIVDKAEELGLAYGPHHKLAIEVEKILEGGRYRMVMNASGIGAALMADRGFTSREYYHYLILGFSAGIIPCFIDSSNKKEGAFFPLSCERLNYRGNEKRRW